ncbi:MAG: sensor histidine kinase [Desulfitobacteriaceae bacterium]
MSYKKVWILAFVAFLISGILMHTDLFIGNMGLSDNAAARVMSTGWTISDGNKVLYENADFLKVGSLKKQSSVVLLKKLPDTAGKSLCFITIGYAVEAFVDGGSIYTFGSSLDGEDVWGVKTHIFKVPDGMGGRELRLEFSTNQPANIAVSGYILLDDTDKIIQLLVKPDVAKIIFALFYISIGIFMLIFSLISITFKFRKFDFSMLMLALIALFIGAGILFNIGIIAFLTGPEFVYWSVCLINLVLPIPTLLFVAADKHFEKSRLLLWTALAQGLFLLMWLFCNIFKIDFFLVSWHLYFFALTAILLIGTFAWEFKAGSGRPEIAVSVTAILLTSVINAYGYFTTDSHDTMDLSLIILAFPVLVLMTGKVVLSSLQKEYRMMNENAALRIEGELLYKNYNRTEKYIEETKMIWHDIDKHFSVIGQLAKNGEYDELKHYLEHAGYDMKKTKSAYLCENKLVNAILTDKFSEAKSKSIQTSFTGNLPVKLHIQGNDLCSLLVNMLDNAIEACGRVPYGKEKKLELTLGMKNDFVYFSVSNSSAGVPVMEGDELITFKEDKGRHGYGIPIIQRIARKYDGAFDMIPLEGSFTIRAALKNGPVEEGQD